MDAWSYSLSREPATLKDRQSASDKVFGGQRYDDHTIEKSDFQHCTFNNVSFLRTRIKNARFIDCVFFGCYFRRGEINGCTFTGCRFFDCDFSFIAMHGSNLRYVKFDSCALDYDTAKHNLPNEHNLREDLCKNLAVQCGQMGYLTQARLFRLEEIKAREANLRAALLGETDWHRRHFDGFRKLKALFELMSSWANGFLWGHGERIKILLRNTAVLSFVILPSCFYLLGDDFRTTTNEPLELHQAFYLSLQVLLPVDLGVDGVPVSALAKAITVCASVAGLLISGLFVAYLLRWILRR